MSGIRSHKDLDVLQFAMTLAADCFAATSVYPREEAYGQTAQLRPASVSIAANIAEGFGRETTAAFIQFLRLAQGSREELETHIMLSDREGLMSSEQATPLLHDFDSVGRMLRNLIRPLETRLAP